MFYIKQFNTLNDYNQYIESEDLILPNVSSTDDEVFLFYNPVKNEWWKNYMTIEAIEDETTIGFLTPQLYYNDNEDLYYSIDNSEWKSFSEYEESTGYELPLTINKGQVIAFKGNLTTQSDSFCNAGIRYFTIDKKINLKGNCMSLIYGDEAENKNYFEDGYDNAFICLFQDNNVVKIYPDFLPATKLVPGCYYGMFSGCALLTDTPILPALELPQEFICNYGHTNFGCYESMFAGCTSLVNAPELPAKKLTPYCYMSMFSGCTNLSNITMLANISDNNSLTNWVLNVSSNGTFTKDSSITSLPSGVNGIPTGWDIVNV